MQVSWLLAEHFPLTTLILLPYLLFLVVGSEIASPDLVSLDSQGSSALPWSSERQAAGILSSRESFFRIKQTEAWDSRLRPAASLPIAWCK